MSLVDKILGKSDAEILKEQIRKDRNASMKFTQEMAKYSAALERAREVFQQTIDQERLNVLERRRKRMGDAAQKLRIHDAAVGLIAIQEAEMDLKSAVHAKDMTSAKKKLGFVVRQMNKLDPYNGMTKKEILAQYGGAFEDTNETESFVERSELVDEQFVEALIEGYTLEECLEKSISAPIPQGRDFNASSQEDMAMIDSILKKNAEKR